ncbi:tetratricopeptide repeat protein [Pseudohongiella sp.]|uniref:Uncharacterized protein n=1 Tax=marine sediment metagenome TaxID=412755 RepID=A0A0F9W763_9ZZZZ|nr:tetratricopeptide repeat protein [Pseudohongiella sp.]HDZ09340.1 tetratricopeptide repeat protein [Pseudohongiella sp.]HEA63811.1 tetratricopeptide repeat protein [Pseudohongiella sp.]
MSLVNDMLRDLDARRREAPTRGLGAEKLVPAAEADARRSRRRSLLAGVVLLCVLATLVATLFLSGGGVSTGSLAPVNVVTDTASEGVEEQTATMARTQAQPELSAQAPGTQVPVARDEDTLNELTARLERLEQQNRALQAQASQAASGEPGSQAAVQTHTLQSQSEQRAQQTVSGADQSRDWSAQQVPLAGQETERGEAGSGLAEQTSVGVAPDLANVVAPSSGANTGSSSRSPRELSFEDRDRQQVQLALQQWSSGQRLTALQTLDSFTFENAEAHRSRETMAKLLLQQGETERALQAVELGLTIAPQFDGYRKVKARVLLGQGAADQALGVLSGNAPSASADTEYHDLLATAYLSAQRYDSAAVSYRMLLQQDESVGRWWYGMGSALEAQGRLADAISAYDRALRSGGLSVTLRQNSQQKLQALRQTVGVN